eukprot:15203824-Alexandrium_andersonii.AAC.1
MHRSSSPALAPRRFSSVVTALFPLPREPWGPSVSPSCAKAARQAEHAPAVLLGGAGARRE